MWGLTVGERKQDNLIKESINLNNVRLQLQGGESWMLIYTLRVRRQVFFFWSKYLVTCLCSTSNLWIWSLWLKGIRSTRRNVGKGLSNRINHHWGSLKFDLAAARIPGLDLRTVTATQERLWTAGMQAQTHHLELVVKPSHLLPCRWEEIEERWKEGQDQYVLLNLETSPVFQNAIT